MEARRPSVSEYWTVVGSIFFGLLCLVMAVVGQSLSSELLQGQQTLAASIQETKAAMKDPNFYVMLITDNGPISDSESVAKRLQNAHAGIHNVEEATKELTSKLAFYEMLSMTFTAITLMTLVALLRRYFQQCDTSI